MSQENTNTGGRKTPATLNGADKRAAPRFALLLRGAKLLYPQGEFLCIIRDVSETGARLKLFHPLPGGDRHFLLEQPSGMRLPAEVIWEREGEAGVRFASAIDVNQFISEECPFPRRSIRLNVTSPIMIFANDLAIPGTLRNISREGAKIESTVRLSIGQSLRITGQDIPDFEANVCWRKNPDHGVVFRRGMDLTDLALIVASLNQRGGSDQPPNVDVA